MPQIFIKDPDSDKDYAFDWSEWLETGDSILSYTLTTDDGITVHDDSLNDDGDKITFWVSSGVAGKSYQVSCKITTAQGRTDERTIEFKIIQE